jgi:hypothetical protein
MKSPVQEKNMDRQAHGFQLRIMAALQLPSVIDGVDVFSGKLA